MMNASDIAHASATTDVLSPVSPPTILSASIGPYPKSLRELFLPTVKATFSDGQVRDLFSFYPDEIDFTESELVGKTEAQARYLRHQKDVAYLQDDSPRAKRHTP